MDLGLLASIASELGALGVSVLVLAALMSERLVPKGRLDDMRRERDAADKRADDAIRGLDRVVDIFRRPTP